MQVLTENKVVPKLRFKEFEGDWIEKKLGDVGKLLNGLTYSPNDIADDGVLVLRSSNIQSNLIALEDNVFVNVSSFTPVKENDILICVRNGSKRLIGKNCLIDKNTEGVAFGAFMTIYRSLNNKFIFQLFSNSSYFKAIHRNLGATINSINNNDLRKFRFFFPELPEQKKIADFLSSVDNKLQNLKKKKELLEQYKKGLMQKIFSQEIRFKDDNGNDYPDWEKKKLGEIGTILGGGTPSTENQSYWNGNTPWISSSDLSESNIFEININRYVSDVGIQNSATKIIPSNSVLFVSRVGVGKIAVNKSALCTSQDFANLVLKKDISNFIGYLFVSRNELLHKYSQGTSIKGFTNSDLKSISIFLPAVEEQKKIADFLSSVDNKINLVDTQITQTESFKKGLLQQMFVAA